MAELLGDDGAACEEAHAPSRIPKNLDVCGGTEGLYAVEQLAELYRCRSDLVLSLSLTSF